MNKDGTEEEILSSVSLRKERVNKDIVGLFILYYRIAQYRARKICVSTFRGFAVWEKN
jgi:hypothetical protein